MPEFIAQHVPGNLDQFTTGYLEAVEWLLDDEIDRDAIEGFAPETIAAAKADCAAFQEANRLDLDATNADDHRHGVDFWLTRNRHGAGFWDRGYGSAGERLTDTAWDYRPVDAYLGDDNLIYLA